MPVSSIGLQDDDRLVDELERALGEVWPVQRDPLAFADELRKKDKRVIMLWLAGGASQFETWDPKPGRPTGGPFGEIGTSVGSWDHYEGRFDVNLPLRNVWLGTSIESDRYAYRADALRATPAAVRFISAEPLLGPLPSLDLTGIDWLILGGESGPGSRPMDLGWVRELIGMARDAGAAVFVKQLGLRWAGSGKGGDWSTWPEDLRVREYPADRQAVPA